MKTTKPLLQYVQDFFGEYLRAQRGASTHTVLSYRDTLKLFLTFVARQGQQATTQLTLEDLQAEQVLSFLDDLETTRQNSVMTRNVRLAALRTFFTYLAAQDPLRAGQYQRIVAIPLKRGTRAVMDYLTVEEVQALLAHLDRTSLAGRRDYALLSFLYNTGARVQEAAEVRVEALALTTPPSVTLTGKGRKTRRVPLWAETATMLRQHLEERGWRDRPQAHLFVNARGEPLSRFGIRYLLRAWVKAAAPHCPSLQKKRISPHTLRHTTAMHLLQAGVDLVVIKSWLGHVNLATTHGYVEIDLEMKRKALSTCAPPGDAAQLRQVIQQHQDVIRWLDTL